MGGGGCGVWGKRCGVGGKNTSKGMQIVNANNLFLIFKENMFFIAVCRNMMPGIMYKESA